MKKVTNLLRLLVGTLFLLSGFVKANDPLGLSYKIAEFLELWGWFFFGQFTLSFSIFLICTEVAIGCALVLGFLPKLTTYATLAINAFFLSLTAYATFSGKIHECGCFGDCFPLPAAGSFYKDVFLTIASVVLVKTYHLIEPVYRINRSARICLSTTILCLCLCFYVLFKLPIVDCLPFKKGVHLREKLHEAASTASVETYFHYEKDGQEYVFKGTELPADFSEDDYFFIRREQRQIPGGKSTDWTLQEFHLFTLDGQEKTEEILESPHCYVLFLRTFSRDYIPQILPTIRELLKTHAFFPVYVVASRHTEKLSDALSSTRAQVLHCDNVLIRTIARANETLYEFKDGVIVRKSAL